MSADFVSRVVGAIVLAVVGALLGVYISPPEDPPYWYSALFLFVGALFGLVLTPYLTVRPFVALRRSIRQAPVQKLLAVVIGLVVGLIVAALLSFPLSFLPEPFKRILSVRRLAKLILKASVHKGCEPRDSIYRLLAGWVFRDSINHRPDLQVLWRITAMLN